MAPGLWPSGNLKIVIYRTTTSRNSPPQCSSVAHFPQHPGIGPDAESNPVTLRIKYGITGFVLELVVFVPIRLRNQIWDKNNYKRAWCVLGAWTLFERCWNICAKLARGRVHPVAVLTASSRMSQNSRPDGQSCTTNRRRRVRAVQRAFIAMIGRGEQQHASHTLAAVGVYP